MLFYFNLDQSQYDNGGVLVENRRVYSFFLNENLIMKQCPALLANSLEFLGMKAKSREEALVLTKIRNNEEIKEKDLVPKQTNKIGKNSDMKSLCLILAHCLGLEEAAHPAIQEDLHFLLSKAPYLIQMMVEVGVMIAFEFRMGKQRVKRITPRCILCLINFNQNLV
mmetsp:Transcript_9058/g.6801  ORF Transcript_9058/g.6801 Transcript_9058/m.6801 type:complete len:167 (-) Transcript_9058:343-843(-)